MRLAAFDYFRGIAIVFIVAGHSYGIWQINSFGERVFANIVAGGTSLFVFISGFLFHHVYYKNYHYRNFLAKKIKYVFTPYLILSLTGMAYYIYSSYPLPYADVLGIGNFQSSADYIEMVGIYLWTGRIATAYWYIPFILIIFAFSPFFVRFVRCSAELRIAVFVILVFTAMFIQRPAHNLSPLHSVIYFMPVYILGMICSIHREPVIEFIRGKSVILGLVVLLLAVLQALLYEGHGNYHKEEIFSYGGLDILIVQKIVLCFFILSVLQKYESRNIPALKLLASSSFAIFFIHPWVLMFSYSWILKSFYRIKWAFFPGLNSEVVVFVITVPIVIIISLLIAYVLKLGLKTGSRYITGW